MKVEAVRDDGAILITEGKAAAVVLGGQRWITDRDSALSRSGWEPTTGTVPAALVDALGPELDAFAFDRADLDDDGILSPEELVLATALDESPAGVKTSPPPPARSASLPLWLIRTSTPVELRRYNDSQKRDPNGEWGDGVPGPSAAGLTDTLKLAGKINLEPDEKLLGSAKVDGDQGGVRMALTDRGGKRMLRLGAGGEGYGQQHRDDGIPAWDGNAAREPVSPAEQQRLDGEWDTLDAEYDTASPARQAEISARQDAIREELFEDATGFSGTAILDPYSMERLASRIRPAMLEAVEQEKIENAAWDEIEALEKKGNPDPGRMAELQRIINPAGRDAGITFVQGVIPGSAWGDVHYSVEIDDLTVGTRVHLGVQPKGAPDDWGDGRDWMGQFDVAETKKFLRLLDQYSASASRSSDPEGALVFERFNDQHAPAGSSTGGQFAAGDGGASKTASAATSAAAKSAKSHSGRPRPPSRRPPDKSDSGTLAYDPGSNHGTGYDSRDGDVRVHALQDKLISLGITDSSGKPLKKDGKLGPKTTSAVKKLQTALGLKPDGKVTPALLAQIKSMKSLPAKKASAVKKRSAVMDYCVRSFGFQFEERGQRNGDGRTLEGYAAVFNAPTRIAAVGGDFDEVISPGAFTRSIRQRMPVLQFEHGRDPRVGAVPIGSIEDLSEDSQGLHVRATLFDNPVVEPVRQAIAHKAIKGMSFRFNVAVGGDNWARRTGAIDLRTVGDADVHELGPVVFPAYDQTTVSVRSLLAQLGPEEHLALLRELAHDLRSIDPDDTARQPSARSSGSGDTDEDDIHREYLSPRQRLDEGALRSRGILK